MGQGRILSGYLQAAGHFVGAVKGSGPLACQAASLARQPRERAVRQKSISGRQRSKWSPKKGKTTHRFWGLFHDREGPLFLHGWAPRPAGEINRQRKVRDRSGCRWTSGTVTRSGPSRIACFVSTTIFGNSRRITMEHTVPVHKSLVVSVVRRSNSWVWI